MKRGWITAPGNVYFTTNTVKEWIPIFCCVNIILEVFDNWTFLREKRKIKIFSFVIMPDHLHYIIDIPDGDFSLSDFTRDFKKRTGRKVREALESNSLTVHPFYSNNSPLLNSLKRIPKLFHKEKKRRHRFSLWRQDDTPIILESESIFEQKLNYIHLNPVKKGLAENIQGFPFSSWNKNQKYFQVDEVLF